jgi:phosphate transport system substrate-binding protein
LFFYCYDVIVEVMTPNLKGDFKHMKQNVKRTFSILMIVALSVMLFTGCAPKTTPAPVVPATTEASTEAPAPDAPELSGEILIDGSSTVFPIAEAVAEEFGAIHRDVKIPIGVSGTGGGFKKFTTKETDISNASRPIKDSEKEIAAQNGVAYTEFKIAFDGLTVVVNAENDFASDITVEELQKIWAPDSTVMKWSDVRSEWPAEDIKLYAPGTDSGTFDYFTEEINGESGAIRPDFTPSEDDNVLVQGVAGDKYAMAFFGFAYYLENQDTIKALKIDGGNGPVDPTFETIADGSYAPLSRPLFIYVNDEAMARPEVKAFIEFFLTEGPALMNEVGYIALPDSEYQTELGKIK